jgi:virginiamycin B lyase
LSGLIGGTDNAAGLSEEVLAMVPVTRRFVLGSFAACALAPCGPAAAVPSTTADAPGGPPAPAGGLQSWALATPHRTGIHDVAPAPDGGVWFSAQASGELGWFDPVNGRVALIPLGNGSAPHGVVPGPDGAAWLTDGGQNAIVRVSWPDREVRRFPLPEGSRWANLNTCAFDGEGRLWFTGQSGVVGHVDPRRGEVDVKAAPRGPGPYGMCATPSGAIWYASLAGSFIAQVDLRTGESRVVAPPTKEQGARRIWSDTRGRLWVSEWNSGQLSMHDPSARTPASQWRAWKLPGDAPHAYAVYVDERDHVWLSDFGANAVLRFDPQAERFESYPLPRESAAVRQIHGRRGEVWLPESGSEHVSRIRFA